MKKSTKQPVLGAAPRRRSRRPSPFTMSSEDAGSTMFLLRDINPAVWEQVRTKANAAGLPLRTVILELLGAYAAGTIDIESSITVRRVR